MEFFNKAKERTSANIAIERQAIEKRENRKSSYEMASNVLSMHNRIWQLLPQQCQARICTEISNAIDCSTESGGLILRKSPEKIWNAFNQGRGACIYSQDEQGLLHFYRSCLYYKVHDNPDYPSAIETGALIASPLSSNNSGHKVIGYNRDNRASHTPGSCVLEAVALLAKNSHPNDPIIATVRAPQSILAANKAGFTQLNFAANPELQALTCTKDCVGNVYQGATNNSIKCRAMNSNRSDDCKLLIYNPEVLQNFKNNFNQAMQNQTTKSIKGVRESLNLQ